MPGFQPRKSIASRYANTTVNTKYYVSIDVASGNTTKDDVQVSVGVKSNSGQGFIWAPYIPVTKGYYVNGEYFTNETTEEIAERIRGERKKKLERIFKDNI